MKIKIARSITLDLTHFHPHSRFYIILPKCTARLFSVCMYLVQLPYPFPFVIVRTLQWKIWLKDFRFFCWRRKKKFREILVWLIIWNANIFLLRVLKFLFRNWQILYFLKFEGKIFGLQRNLSSNLTVTKKLKKKIYFDFSHLRTRRVPPPSNFYPLLILRWFS